MIMSKGKEALLKELDEFVRELPKSWIEAGPYSVIDCKSYMGNLHFNITESQLREIFEPFGPVEVVQLPLNLETRHYKGFGFVQFSHLEHAKAAQSLNGKLEIASRTIKVSCVTDHVGNQSTTTKFIDLDDDEGGLFVVNNVKDLILLMMHNRTYYAEIDHDVSTRKRKEIVERAAQLDVVVTNKTASLCN
ncbi:hypothetical protein RJT34_16692 [Clitoria ternatea]|uniref:RRM domain-containing protein n=1 Tax=Clitoria ternatea TaxID=43366 RepID=A0AAN9J7K4_CLITE